MKTIPSLIFLSLMSFQSIAGSIKGAGLDHEKTLESIEECKRVADWKLLKNADTLSIACEDDALKFLAKNQTNVNRGGPLRIGNFNLLHPGMDKTLFKDFDLVAELINGEFDLMAGIELINVLGDSGQKNKRLRSFIEDRQKKLQASHVQVTDQEQKVKEFEAQLTATDSSKSQLELMNIEIVPLREQLSKDKIEIISIEQSLAKAQSDVVIYSRPLTIARVEIRKRQRLANLAAAQTDLKRLTANLATKNALIESTEVKIKEIESRIQTIINVPQASPEYIAKLSEMKQVLLKLQADAAEAQSVLNGLTKHYAIAGYLKLLNSLRDLDPNWSLVVSPHGDAAEETNVQELVGYYYRANKVSLSKNVHCSKRFNKDSPACYPNFYEDYMGQDMTSVFSRRPFLATFTNGKSDFSMLAAHVVFESPKSEQAQKDMLMKVFGVDNVNVLGVGITKQNYARFAEVAVSLDMVQRLKAEGLGKIIYTGDLNLEYNNQFWKKLMVKFPGSTVLVEDATSVSETRSIKGAETNGLASNYDHFILSEDESRNCRDAARVNFISNDFSNSLKSKYLVRVDAAKGPYVMAPGAEKLIADRVTEISPRITDMNILVSNSGEIKLDAKRTEADLLNFKERVFTSQLSDATFYKLFVQIISDHLPIKIVCEF